VAKPARPHRRRPTWGLDMLYFLIFALSYCLNITYMSVFYHRGFTHGSVILGPRMRRFVGWTGGWVTGLDPKAWACMHRLHHLYSDGEQDPHSPHQAGLFGVFRAQLLSYIQVLKGLAVGRKRYTEIVADLDIPVSWANRGRLWFAPYLLHVGIGVVIGLLASDPFLGACYWLGLMSHPVQGWMVNALGHAHGYRNFDTPDQSRNNTIVAWLVLGEGYQNNHHRFPRSAQFSWRWWEVDLGFVICRAMDAVGLLEIRREGLDRPSPELAPETSAF
jgi:stearoyl-CoA desaturase (delta-9 desaturase)